MSLKILAIADITSTAVSSNGQVILKNDQNAEFALYTRNIYKKLNLKYPKFFKMDELSQLAFLSAEVLLQNIAHWNGSEVAIVLGNKNSSVQSDLRFYDSICDKDDYFPSPAVFVYTLPNIMLGEICIRHQITGENSCFMMDNFDTDFIYQYVNCLFEEEKYRYCITGFVDFTAENYGSRLFLIGDANIPTGPLCYDFDKTFNEIIQ